MIELKFLVEFYSVEYKLQNNFCLRLRDADFKQLICRYEFSLVTFYACTKNVNIKKTVLSILLKNVWVGVERVGCLTANQQL